MAHLSVSTTREGTDPPATDVVPDKTLTTLGVLGWRRFGETASGDSNYKSGGSHNGSVADIGSPSWGYYGGSNNKQAALSPYTDGNSPTSSAGTRSYRTTAVTGAGMRVTIPLSGQSIKVGLLLGSYGATPRIAASLSDSSASSVTQDHAAGAATVGWWHTVILADATSDAANLVIDVTAHSGTSLQWMGFYVDYGTPVIRSVTPSSPYPGQSVTVAIGGFPTVPTTANSTYNGVSQTISGATITSVPLTWPARSAFRFGGAHAATRWSINRTLTLGNGTQSANATVQTSPQNAGAFGTKNSSAAVIDLGTWNGGAIVLATNDDVYGHVTVGSATVNAPYVDYIPLEAAVTVEWTYFDVSAGSWSGLTTSTYEEASETRGVVRSILRPVIRSVLYSVVN